MMQTPGADSIIENLQTNLSHKITASIFSRNRDHELSMNYRLQLEVIRIINCNGRVMHCSIFFTKPTQLFYVCD